MELLIDPARVHHPDTGIYVRARLADGGFAGVDIAHLDADSLRAWLRSRGEKNEWAEAVVAMILGHDMAKWGPVP